MDRPNLHPRFRASPRRVPTVPKVIYIGEDGDERAVDAVVGESVMATAVKNGVPGIIGECGGNASCATCHVWVEDEFLPLVGTPGDTEEDLLDLGVADRREGSRLSCQIAVTDELDGLTVVIPADQY
jgi:ferredoxin, 2Fe-2S